MNVRVGLETVVSVLPEKVLTVKDQSYLEPVIPEQLRGRFRFPKEVRRFRDDSAAEILALKVARKALEHAGLKSSDIDFILCTHCGGKYLLPMIGSHIQHELGIALETPAVNIPNASASFIDACEVAWNLVLSEKYKRVLIVAVSAMETKGGLGRVDLTDPLNGVMGDGAGAAIVSTQNLKCEFLSYYSRTFSETYDYSVAELRAPAHLGLKGAGDQPPMGIYLHYAPQFFHWWQEHAERFGIEGITRALDVANLSLSDLDIVVSHHPFEHVYDQWIAGAEKAGLSRDKWKNTWDKYGDLAPATVPVNMAEFWERGELKKDSIMAWLTSGAGGHSPTMIVKWLI